MSATRDEKEFPYTDPDRYSVGVLLPESKPSVPQIQFDTLWSFTPKMLAALNRLLLHSSKKQLWVRPVDEISGDLTTWEWTQLAQIKKLQIKLKILKAAYTAQQEYLSSQVKSAESDQR